MCIRLISDTGGRARVALDRLQIEQGLADVDTRVKIRKGT